MYTSGSTGQPKGVQMTHGSVWHYIQAIQNLMEVSANDVYLHTASFSFSSSIRQLIVPLSQGAKVIIATREQTQNPLSLFQLIKKQSVTVFDTVASVWRYGLQAIENLDNKSKEALLKSQLRMCVFSGGLLPCQLLKKIRSTLTNKPRFFNVYGQTETIGVCAYPIPDNFDQEKGYVPVGYPYPHNQVHILDENLQPMLVGEAGELHVAGANLARGYLNRPQLNANQFISNPFIEIERENNPQNSASLLYKTGDVARYLPDGSLEILGRVDFQVKIREMRIELGEIEAVLEEYSEVRESVVTAREDVSGEKRLVAYVVAKQKNPVISTNKLRSFLSQKLPDYMVPSSFVLLDVLPLTPNGKLDRHALPAPNQTRQESAETFVPPRDELEEQLTKIWERVLGIQPIGVKDNFFELGGHSLLALSIFMEIEKNCGKNLPLSTLFQAGNVETLSNIIRQKEDWSPLWSSLVEIQPSGSKPPLFCVHGGHGEVLYYYDLARYLGQDRPFYALRARGQDGKEPPRTEIEDMASHYIKEIRIIQPEGPYFIGGSSFGGMVAFEMAQQLHTEGETVSLLVLFDTYCRGMQNRQLQPLPYRIYRHFRNLIKIGPNYILDKIKTKFQWISKDKMAIKFHQIAGIPLPYSLQSLLIWEAIWNANLKAVRDYTPQIYPGKITLIRSINNPQLYSEWYDQDPQLGWGRLAGGGLEIHDVPGDHESIFREPHIQVLAEKLSNCLEVKH